MARPLGLTLVLAAITAAHSGCGFEVTPPNGKMECAAPGSSRRCPDGYYCAGDGTCWRNGEAPSTDAGTDLPQDTGSDLVIDVSPELDASEVGGSADAGNGGDAGDGIVLVTHSDDELADFAQGKLDEAGAKIYLSANGNVQLLDRWDLNGDGFIDLAFAIIWDAIKKHDTQSKVYWGSAAGPDPNNPASLQTYGANDVVAADLDDDGYSDLVFANSYHDTEHYDTRSFIYWGSATGFSGRRTELPTLGAMACAVGDLDRDGHLDIVFGNSEDNAHTPNVASYVYWGPDFATKTSLTTHYATGVVIADLNGDDKLDLVFSNYSDVYGASYYAGQGDRDFALVQELPSGKSGRGVAAVDLGRDGKLDLVFANASGAAAILHGPTFDGASRQELPLVGARSASVADMDSDGIFDLVFTTGAARPGGMSSVFFGSAEGYLANLETKVYSEWSSSSLAIDLNADQITDLVFAKGGAAGTPTGTSTIHYWEREARTPSKLGSINEPNISLVSSTDPGSVASRSPTLQFKSRVFDSGQPATYTRLTLKGSVPAACSKCSIRVQLCSSAGADGIAAASCFGPSSEAPYYVLDGSSSSFPIAHSSHQGHRYIRYEASLTGDFGNSPILDSVTIVGEPATR